MTVVGDVPEGLCGESNGFERVDPRKELVIDHAV
jgi:hypothetical protein